jgi:hypothetical protein
MQGGMNHQFIDLEIGGKVPQSLGKSPSLKLFLGNKVKNKCFFKTKKLQSLVILNI